MPFHETDEFGFDAPAPLGHPGRRGLPNGHETGAEISDRLPDFELPDQSGRLVDFHADSTAGNEDVRITATLQGGIQARLDAPSRGALRASRWPPHRDQRECLIPRTETLRLEVPIDPINVPNLGLFRGNGQRETTMDSAKHMRRLLGRKARARPLGFVRGVFKQIRLNLAARRRGAQRAQT